MNHPTPAEKAALVCECPPCCCDSGGPFCTQRGCAACLMARSVLETGTAPV